jgi:hypothetical protein
MDDSDLDYDDSDMFRGMRAGVDVVNLEVRVGEREMREGDAVQLQPRAVRAVGATKNLTSCRSTRTRSWRWPRSFRFLLCPYAPEAAPAPRSLHTSCDTHLPSAAKLQGWRVCGDAHACVSAGAACSEQLACRYRQHACRHTVM